MLRTFQALKRNFPRNKNMLRTFLGLKLKKLRTSEGFLQFWCSYKKNVYTGLDYKIFLFFSFCVFFLLGFSSSFSIFTFSFSIFTFTERIARTARNLNLPAINRWRIWRTMLMVCQTPSSKVIKLNSYARIILLPSKLFFVFIMKMTMRQNCGKKPYEGVYFWVYSIAYWMPIQQKLTPAEYANHNIQYIWYEIRRFIAKFLA